MRYYIFFCLAEPKIGCDFLVRQNNGKFAVKI